MLPSCCSNCGCYSAKYVTSPTIHWQNWLMLNPAQRGEPLLSYAEILGYFGTESELSNRDWREEHRFIPG